MDLDTVSSNMDTGTVTIIFPHKQAEIGLQQRATIVVKTLGTHQKEIPVAISVRVVDMYGAEVLLCAKQKKDHDYVLKTLNEEFFLGGAKADVTFYCKGANSGGCKTKKPSKLRLCISLVYDDGSCPQFSSPLFLVKGNRRTHTKTMGSYSVTTSNTAIMQDRLKSSKYKICSGNEIEDRRYDEIPVHEVMYSHSDRTHSPIGIISEPETHHDLEISHILSPTTLELHNGGILHNLYRPGNRCESEESLPTSLLVTPVPRHASLPRCLSPLTLINPQLCTLPKIMNPRQRNSSSFGDNKLPGSAFSLKRPLEDPGYSLSPLKKMNINHLVNQ
jgi:hypothetical protein